MRPRERMAAAQWVPPWLRHQHEARYAWAAERCAGLRVLDCASGNAYGARALLQAGAGRVVALDMAAEAVIEAKAMHAAPRLGIGLADATRLPFADRAFDLYVSFETVEHVADDAGYVREARRVVAPGGTFVCSTPNRALTNPGISIGDKPFNPFHLREYTRGEIEALLRPAFAEIEWLGQSIFATLYAKLLHAAGRRRPALAVRAHQLRKLAGAPFDTRRKHWPQPYPSSGEPEVLIAVCR